MWVARRSVALGGPGNGDRWGKDDGERADHALRHFRTWAWITAAATFVLLLLGAGVVANGAGLSCPGWPLCGGRVVPVFSGVVVVEWSHRVGALVVTALSLITAAAARPLHRQGPWTGLSLTAVGLLAMQVVLGAVVVETNLTPLLVVAHQGLGIALLCLWLVAATIPGRPRHRVASGGTV